jgi:hypothetical protein
VGKKGGGTGKWRKGKVGREKEKLHDLKKKEIKVIGGDLTTYALKLIAQR